MKVLQREVVFVIALVVVTQFHQTANATISVLLAGQFVSIMTATTGCDFLG